MPVSAATLRLLIAAGLTGDQLVAVVESIDSDAKMVAPVVDVQAERRRASDRARKSAAREAVRGHSAEASAEMVPDKAVSPTPPSQINLHTPPSPPTGAQAPQSPGDAELAVEAYNAVAERLQWPLAAKLTAQRRSRITARLADCGLDGWRAAMERAAKSPFLRGESRSQGHEQWRPDLDFFLQPSSFQRLIEGGYDARAGPPAARKEGQQQPFQRWAL